MEFTWSRVLNRLLACLLVSNNYLLYRALIFFNIYFYLFEKQRDKERTRSFFHWFTLQTATMTRAVPGWSQEWGCPACFSCGWQVPRYLGFLLCCPRCIDRELDVLASGAAGPLPSSSVWDAGITDHGLTHCTTNMEIKIYNACQEFLAPLPSRYYYT